jgi:molybdate transport system substrate-binding protein
MKGEAMKRLFSVIFLLFLTANVYGAELQVSAPQSVKKAFLEISTLFEKNNPDWKVNLRVGKPAEARKLISQGTSVDVFFMKEDKTIQSLQEKKLVQNARRFLADDLVVVGPENSQLQVTEPSKLVFPELKGVALYGEKHPVGKAARDYLQKHNLFETVIAKQSSKKNTKEVFQSLTGGETDWAIVYASDATHTKGIKILYRIPQTEISPEFYYIGMVAKSRQPEGAQLYLDSLNSTIALKIFENAGFRVIKE